MNKLIIGIIGFLILFTACKHKTQQPVNGKDVVAVTVLPQKYLVDRISGGFIDVSVLVPPGANHEEYSLLPSQLKEISTCKAWLQLGYIGFELASADKITMVNPNMQQFVISEGINLITEEEAEHGDHVHIHGVDPHFWMSPGEMLILAQNTCKALVKLYPEKEEAFHTNLASLENDIHQLDQNIQETLKDSRGKSFLVFHPVLTYFARQYGLEQIALEDHGKEPSARHVKDITEKALAQKIRIIFVQKELDQSNAETIAREIGGKVIQINPLDYDWLAQMEGTINNLKIALNE